MSIRNAHLGIVIVDSTLAISLRVGQHVKAMVQLLRVHQWLKNGLILVPIVFSGNLHNPLMLIKSFIAMGCFSILASSIYILNDTIDAPRDRNHPKKRLRPIARGAVSLPVAISYFMILSSLSLWATEKWLGLGVLLLCLGYYVTNLAYSLFLKQHPPIDIIIVALFYLVRPFVGALAIGVVVSNWLIITTFFAALYLVSLKRLSELQRVHKGIKGSRKNLEQYSSSMLKTQGIMSLTMSIVCYAIYASTFPALFVLTTIPLVGLAMRMIMLQEIGIDQYETPEKIVLKDKIALLFLFVWAISVVGFHWG